MYQTGLVSISFRSLTPEQVIRAAAEAGLSCIEWGSDVHAPCSDRARLEQIAAMQKQAGLRCCSYGTYFRLGRDRLEDLTDYISAAGILGTDVLRLWCGVKGSAQYTSAEREALIDQCRQAAEIARQNRVTLCMECHGGTLTDTGESALALMQAVSSPNFRMYFQPNSPDVRENLAYISLLAPYITTLHVFNWRLADRFPLKEGLSDWKKYLELLPGNRNLLLEFMPDDRVESLSAEAEALAELAFPKAVLLCENEETIRRVYPKEVLCRLHQAAGMDLHTYSGEEVRENPGFFSRVQSIFSSWGMPTFTEEEIKRVFPRLNCIFYSAGTVQYFARPFLNCGVRIFSAWAANAVPVCEYTVSQILLANKGFFAASRLLSAGKAAEARAACGHYPGNYGASVGIIGAGMIGKMVIRQLKQHQLKILVSDPYLSEADAQSLGVEKCSLETLFSSCNVISNHTANKPETVGMLHRALFASMPPYAVFLNTGRGAQVREEDLAEVLQERPDLTAVLDVTCIEPPVPGHPFYFLDNCVLTPHIAGSSGAEVCRMAEYMEQEYSRFLAGDSCRYEVTLRMLDTMA